MSGFCKDCGNQLCVCGIGKANTGWRTDFENTKKGLFLVSIQGKSYVAYKFDKRYKKCNVLDEKTDFWRHDIYFEDIDAWMPMPEGVK